MTVRVQVRPELLRWARARANISVADLSRRFPNLAEWESGARAPTLKQLEHFANATYTAVGLLLLAQPPKEDIPIPDFRTMVNQKVMRPTPDLLDTVFLCQQRQEWYRDFARSNGAATLELVGSLTTADDIVAAADRIRAVLGFGLDARSQFSTWSDALRGLIALAEEVGVLVMVSGVVGSNTHRVLDPDEFRGFALIDTFAPVVFINGSDTKAAQIFSVAHELAHIWLGATGLSNATLAAPPSHEVERWCNRVAAELLVPLSALRAEYRDTDDLTAELDRLARVFKVSTLVVLNRIRDIGAQLPGDYGDLYSAELARVMALRGGGSGGNFYNTQPVRVSKRFARAVIGSALEGQTLFRDAYQLLGFKKHHTFVELAHSLGVE